MENVQLWVDWILAPEARWLISLPTELDTVLRNPAVWIAIAACVVLAGLTIATGTWVAIQMGILSESPSIGDLLGVGLGTGLIVCAVAIAALLSGGRSAFTPIALGIACAVAISLLAGRTRAQDEHGESTSTASGIAKLPLRAVTSAWLIVASIALLVGILYGTTLVPGPRQGVQPVEFMDEAYYPVLAAHLAATGTESVTSPAGFDELPGLPGQAWYHWGELWLTAGVIKAFGVEPIPGHFYGVLPLVLVAAAGLMGSLVRTIAGTRARSAYLTGFAGAVLLAPIPIRLYPYFGLWARGLIYGVTLYGLGAIAILLAVYLAVQPSGRSTSWATSIFRGTIFACVIPAHIVLGAFGLAGLLAVAGARALRAVPRPRAPAIVPRDWWPATAFMSVAGLVVILWGTLTGHGIAATGSSPSVQSFNDSWSQSLLLTWLGGGAFLAIPLGLAVRWSVPSSARALLIGTSAALVLGALLWGARLGDFNSFHFFFGPFALLAPLATAVCCWLAWSTLRTSRKRRYALALALLLAAQTAFGFGTGVQRLILFGPGTYPPIGVDMLDAIRGLPATAKLAYACQPFEEISFFDPRLLSITAHTGRDVVPMCFEADVLSGINGADMTSEAPSPFFQWAPQRALYPTSTATPGVDALRAFLATNGIRYIYADSAHPNTLVPAAVTIASSGDARLLALP